MKVIEGTLAGRGVKIGIVAARFNDFISKRLLKACLEELSKRGVRSADITVVWVPGAFEIPVAALRLAKRKNIDAVICLGAVIRGETLHFELVAEGAAYGMMQAALATGKPVVFGVLATDTIGQADKRSQEKGDNKGLDAARTAIEMVRALSSAGKP